MFVKAIKTFQSASNNILRAEICIFCMRYLFSDPVFVNWNCILHLKQNVTCNIVRLKRGKSKHSKSLFLHNVTGIKALSGVVEPLVRSSGSSCVTGGIILWMPTGGPFSVIGLNFLLKAICCNVSAILASRSSFRASISSLLLVANIIFVSRVSRSSFSCFLSLNFLTITAVLLKNKGWDS